jgi:ribosome-binding protein aMBF1 (putative translation factor)
VDEKPKERGIILSNETWKDIVGYDGCYQVSNTGSVKSFYNNRDGKILKLSTNKQGYNTVSLHKENKTKSFSVHRLVATCFISNDNNYPAVNHKDENKTNNNVDNLEWCSYKYNNNYGTRTERASNSKSGTIKINRPLFELGEISNDIISSINYEIDENFPDRVRSYRERNKMSQEVFSKKVGFSKENISRIENGKYKPSKKFLTIFGILEGKENYDS